MPEVEEVVKEKVKKSAKGSVKTKIENIQKQAKEFEVGARKFGGSVKALAGEFDTYTKDVFEKSVAEFHAGIQKQTVENDAAVKKMNMAIKEIQRDIKATAGEFKAYSKEFWG